MKLTWPHVVVIGLVLTAIVVLAITGQDTGALIGLGGLILAGIGVIAGQLPGIRDQANGRMSETLQLVREMALRLAEMQPATPPRDPPE